MLFFIDVLLPLPLPKPFTYWVTEEEYNFLTPGFRVGVPFGKSKMYTGIVYAKHQVAPQTYEPKTIEVILDDHPVVTNEQIRLWEWMSAYYLCSMGSVLRAALPSALLLTSETLIRKNNEVEVKEDHLSDDEYLIYEALDKKTLTVDEIKKIVERKHIFPLIQSLLEKDLIQSYQELKEKFKPKRVRYVQIVEAYRADQKLEQLFEVLNKAPKQSALLLGIYSIEPRLEQWTKASLLLKQTGSTSAALKTLLDKGYVSESFFEEDRIPYVPSTFKSEIKLSLKQKEAFDSLEKQFKNQDVVLLEGVTSSGKTEVYFDLMEQVLAKNKQVLYLLPEISLTSQMIHRLQDRFGSKVVVYHSKFSIHERVEVWNNIIKKQEKAQIVLGARSSVFLPFRDLGLIIVDEEHESSFKQFDPAPRYHARDTAIVLGKTQGAKVLLGSATPSIETRFNVERKKYGYAQLKARFGGILMPRIECIDLKEAHRKKEMTGFFSKELITAIKSVLENNKQVILFQNRRGYAPVMECFTCGHIPQCTNCDVTLTYHQYNQQLRCHYCGYHIAKPISCSACGSNSLNVKGMGTQQIEEQVNELFPEHQVARMDWDSTRGKRSFDNIIDSFTQGEVQILVGTQMLTKGLDFKNVALVGVLNADPLLNFPEFRAHERSFQMLSQVAGRSGRFKEQGQVLIQSYTPEHPVLLQVINNDYEKLFSTQLRERKEYQYPPFFRLIRITLKSKDYYQVDQASQWLVNALNLSLQGSVLGPVDPPIARVRNLYHKQLLIKFLDNASRNKIKEIVVSSLKSFEAIGAYRSIRVSIDVDPQ
ncbi:MAG: replication restart helicase PriA [Flavobacteriales bacterium]|jgi:primosomal protein N' (replication factor Y) (superfamily II helicase)|nr:primosomal protein N' [Flavobacteriaceae bacterium]MDO7581079.1 primosomal protein N' [Flavobacteriaceae bacterium]MDO7591510.1 primosomal protein N' [Flavobacteriaceae bacterium]MDO7598645.1 primosomal protein N' [Flavobacteriaceae bacterium]MDO7602504.1 primosomal protein N' [Flavobacteriaceae bacterium]|tara:strand:- start:112 stop:2562 length:2451 start_codon:yes stop_codon:yes gene_type:complete